LPDNLSPLGPGELLGAGEAYEIVGVEQREPARNVYSARALNLTTCGGCGMVVARSGFCSACGMRVGQASPLLCRVVEQADQDGAFAAEERVKAAQERSPHLAVAPIYDIFAANERKYLITSPQQHTPPTTPQPWPLVFEWTQRLVDALCWLHAIGVTLGGVTAETIGESRDGKRIVQLINASIFTQDAQGTAVADDLHSLMLMLARQGAGTPPAALRNVFRQATHGNWPSAPALAAALKTIEPAIRRATQLCVQSAGLSDQGRMRDGNEDSLGMIEGARHHEADSAHWGLYIVSDGMGGHEGGEVASRLTVAAFLEAALANAVLPSLGTEQPVDWGKHTAAAVHAANTAVYDARVRSRTNMGATLVAATLDGAVLTIAHLGDSRAYLWDGAQLKQLTQDHSLIARLVATGQVKPEEASTHPQRSVLLQSVGDKRQVEPGLSHHHLQPGHTVLLCSDGLHGMIDDGRIAAIMAQPLSPIRTCEALMDAANAAGGEDNVTALVIRFVTFDHGG
jgi:protein phosphatase